MVVGQPGTTGLNVLLHVILVYVQEQDRVTIQHLIAVVILVSDVEKM